MAQKGVSPFVSAPCSSLRLGHLFKRGKPLSLWPTQRSQTLRPARTSAWLTNIHVAHAGPWPGKVVLRHWSQKPQKLNRRRPRRGRIAKHRHFSTRCDVCEFTLTEARETWLVSACSMVQLFAVGIDRVRKRFIDVRSVTPLCVRQAK